MLTLSLFLVTFVLASPTPECEWLGDFRGMAAIVYDDGTVTHHAAVVRSGELRLLIYPRVKYEAGHQRMHILVRANQDGTMTMIFDGWAQIRIFPGEEHVREGFRQAFIAHNGAAIDPDGGRWQYVTIAHTDENASRIYLQER